MKAADLIDYVASEAGAAKTAAKKAVEACSPGSSMPPRRAKRSTFRALASSRWRTARRVRAVTVAAHNDERPDAQYAVTIHKTRGVQAWRYQRSHTRKHQSSRGCNFSHCYPGNERRFFDL
jgi:hypothetical protein